MRAFLLSLALLLSVLPLGGHAQSRLPGLTEGVEYNTIDGGQPYRQLPPGMVEVAEVFAYTCPHCAHMAPMIDDWSRTLPAYARVVYVPGVFGRDDAWARAYFAEETSKTIPLLHRRLFTAIHETGDLPRNADVNQITQYASKVPGVNAAAFSAAIRNDAVLLPKLKLEVAATNDQVDRVVEAILQSAGTGKIGDGKIFVWDLERAVRIRTGELDADAL